MGMTLQLSSENRLHLKRTPALTSTLAGIILFYKWPKEVCLVATLLKAEMASQLDSSSISRYCSAPRHFRARHSLASKQDFPGLRNTYSANLTGKKKKKKKVIHQIGMSNRPYLQAYLSLIAPNRFPLMCQPH